jgi:hypothetical protein
MKKLTLLFAFAFAVVGFAMAQMPIPGEIFAKNPERFNGRKVTLKNIEIVEGHTDHDALLTRPCRPPRGFTQVTLFFKGMPEYNGCFFMAEKMKTQMHREIGHKSTPAQVTIRGDSRSGYMISFYQLGL